MSLSLNGYQSIPEPNHMYHYSSGKIIKKMLYNILILQNRSMKNGSTSQAFNQRCYNSECLIPLTNKKKQFFQKKIKIYTQSGREICPKQDVTFRFSLDTVFPQLYVEISKIENFRYITVYYTGRQITPYFPRNYMLKLRT